MGLGLTLKKFLWHLFNEPAVAVQGLSHSIKDVVEILYFYFTELSLTACYVILFIIVARYMLRNVPKRHSYALWGVVYFKLVSILKLDFFRHSLIPQPQIDKIYYDITPNYTAFYSTEAGVVSQVQSELLTPVPVVTPIYTPALIWSVVFCILLLVSLFMYISMYAKLKKGSCENIGGNIYLSNAISTPFVLGVIHPKIYLPKGLSEQHYNYVVTHEKVHIKRGDHIVKLFAFIITCIHWFNPFVWLSFFLLEKDMEMSCDEKVLQILGNEHKKDYSYCILSLAIDEKFVPKAYLSFGDGDTQKRIKNVLNYKKPAVIATVMTIIGVVIIAIGMLADNGVVYVPNKEVSSDTNAIVEYDLIPMVMVNGELYLDTGYESTITKRNDVIDGEISSQVPSYEEPTENNQSNFGAGYKYQIGVSEGTVELLIDDKWWIFATEEARQKIQFPEKEKLEIAETGKIIIESFDAGLGSIITSVEQIATITNAFSSAKWTEGTSDCLSDFKITIGDNEYLYHLSCGTINDNENNRSLSLDDVQKAELNNIIEEVYYSMTGTVFEGSCPISLPFLEAGKYIMPLDMTNEKVRISRGFFGQYPSHDGLDIAAPLGTDIFASSDGTVIKAEESSVGDGNYVVIKHTNGYYTLYGHCSELIAVEGTEVKQGDVIAKVGSTGNSTGPHLHFELIFGYESEEGGLSIDVYNAITP